MSAHDDVLAQSRFRSSNQRLRSTTYGHRFETADRVPFVCECADPGCFEVVMLSLEEYDAMRAHPNRFLLAAGHEDAEATDERIVEAENGYAIVEKLGAAGAEATRLAERGSRAG